MPEPNELHFLCKWIDYRTSIIVSGKHTKGLYTREMTTAYRFMQAESADVRELRAIPDRGFDTRQYRDCGS